MKILFDKTFILYDVRNCLSGACLYVTVIIKFIWSVTNVKFILSDLIKITIVIYLTGYMIDR